MESTHEQYQRTETNSEMKTMVGAQQTQARRWVARIDDVPYGCGTYLDDHNNSSTWEHG